MGRTHPSLRRTSKSLVYSQSDLRNPHCFSTREEGNDEGDDELQPTSPRLLPFWSLKLTASDPLLLFFRSSSKPSSDLESITCSTCRKESFFALASLSFDPPSSLPPPDFERTSALNAFAVAPHRFNLHSLYYRTVYFWARLFSSWKKTEESREGEKGPGDDAFRM